MESEFETNNRNRGKEGALWIKRIPKIIKMCEKRWGVRVLAPFDFLTWNYVAPAVRFDGTEAVIKIGFPRDAQFKAEISSLEEFNGEGIEKIYEKDIEQNVMLIERVSPGIPLSVLIDDDNATRILARVMKKIWKPPPTRHEFPSITDWARAITTMKIKYRDSKVPHIPAILIDKAEENFRELIATSREPMLLHGDLHHDNVLSSYRDEWLAIDPKGIVGEREFEIAAMIRNPYKKMNRNPNMKNILRNRIHMMADELGFDAHRIHSWCFAQTVLSAVWSIEDEGNRWEHAAQVAHILHDLKL